MCGGVGGGGVVECVVEGGGRVYGGVGGRTRWWS